MTTVDGQTGPFRASSQRCFRCNMRIKGLFYFFPCFPRELEVERETKKWGDTGAPVWLLPRETLSTSF
jgi:hypothetical protein